MADEEPNAVEAARVILTGIHALLKSTTKLPWLYKHPHHCQDGSVETLCLPISSRCYRTTAWDVYIIYSPFGPSLEFKISDRDVPRVLYTLDLANPKSLTRSVLRNAIKETRRRRDTKT